MNNNAAIAAFEKKFGGRPTVIAAAPGRVNLIGEHIDYVGGRVLPFAIAQRTITAAALDDSGRISLRSAALASETSFAADISGPGQLSGWDNYVRGMVFGLRERGVKLPGAQLWIGGDLPPGSGMSSSAALCVSAGMALAKLADVDLPPRDMALIAQKAEHNFAGTPCGIMDQYASCFGREDHAILLDCSKLEHEYVPFQPKGVTVLAIPSGVKHALADGAYEARVKSCKKAVEGISQDHPKITQLCDVTPVMLEAGKSRLDAETYQRARHVVTEIARVNAACEVLEAGDMQELGKLLWATQDSLRDDYEVSCVEIDAMIEVLRGHKGVLGARMVGGGFGGVVLAIVNERATDEVVKLIEAEYYAPNNLAERPFHVKPSSGAAAERLD